MRIFIAADIEGCTGVVHYDQLSEGQPRFAAARRLMTGDINAAIEGALQAAPDATFIVGDGHADMRNVVLEELHPAAELVIGSSNPDNKPLCQCEGIDGQHDLAFLVGFHSMAGTPGGLLAHTLVGTQVKHFRVNDRVVGETAIAHAICQSFGVPIGLVVGNSELLTEAQESLQAGFRFVATKRTLGRTAAVCRTPGVTAKDIAQAAEAAVNDCLNGKLSLATPGDSTRMTVEFFRPEVTARAALSQGVTTVDDYTVTTEHEDAAECFRLLWRAICAALQTTPDWLT
ncbi:MAG: M55 family metallopeptidase [Pseudomonadota bacterium]